jgi:hypothetical protein
MTFLFIIQFYLEFGIAKTKMQAKHNAADQIMAKIKAAAANQEGINGVPYDTILKCSIMYEINFFIFLLN